MVTDKLRSYRKASQICRASIA